MGSPAGTTARAPLVSYASIATLVLLGGLFAVQLASPLRVNTDALTLLDLASKLTDHQPFLTHGAKPLFPIGIPLVFSAMERIGVAGPLAFGLFNLACIAVITLVSLLLYRDAASDELGITRSIRLTLLCVALGNWVLIKHLLIPLTDIPHGAVALGCVLMAGRCRVGSTIRWGWLLGAFALAAAAYFSRRIGVAVVPALAMAVLPPWDTLRASVRRIQPRTAIVVVILTLVVVVLAAQVVISSRLLYLPDFTSEYSHGGIARVALDTLRARLQDAGELVLNIPMNKVPARAHPVFLVAGLAVWIAVAVGWARSLRCPHPLAIYFATYCAVMFVWPFQDPRFWIPVLPILFFYGWLGVEPLTRTVVGRGAALAYVAVYALLTLVSFIYSTRIAFAGSRFPEAYGSGETAAQYHAAWSNMPVEPSSNAALIRRYSGHAPPVVAPPLAAPTETMTTRPAG